MIEVKAANGEFSFPDANTISPEFVVDVLNMAYPGCTGAYITEMGYLLTFYGKKGAPNAGLSLKQGMDAVALISDIPTWMGQPGRFSVRPISLDQAAQVVTGLKRLEKGTPS